MTAWDVKYLTGQGIKGWATETFCNMHLSDCYSKEMLWHKCPFNIEVERLQLHSISMEFTLNWMPRDDPGLLID